METSKEGYTVTEYDFPNAHVRVFRPILTEEERARRMKIIYDAAKALLEEQWQWEIEQEEKAKRAALAAESASQEVTASAEGGDV